MSHFITLIILVICTVVQNSIIEIPARNTNNFSTSPTHFYFKYQSPDYFNVSASDIYIRVPGLKTIFNVAQPTLFEITYQGSCEVYEGNGVHIKLLIDDYLIVGDRFTPNVHDRHLHAVPNVGETVAEFDRWLSQHYLPHGKATLPIIQSAVVLVGPGLHIFDLGVHHADIGRSSIIFGTTMRFKWTIIDHPNLVQGLTLWNKTSTFTSG